MTLATACSAEKDTAAAFDAAYRVLRDRMTGDPDILFAHFTEDHDAAALARGFAALPAAVRVHGGTSCRGLMTEEGVCLDGPALGLLGLRLAATRFGTAFAEKTDDPRAAARAAVHAALADAGRPGEVPDLVLLTAAPGGEEAVLAGIADVLGAAVPVCGGSAADDDGTGNWWVAARAGGSRTGLALTVIFTGVAMSRAFHGGCAPSRFSGVVTATDGPRVISRIDGAPAAEVYEAWYRACAGQPLPRDESFLSCTALTPLGRQVGEIGGFGLYALAHVRTLREDGGIEVLADAAPGQQWHLMLGARDTLASRAARTVESAIAVQCTDVCTVSGALIAFCAGLALTLKDDMPKVQQSLRVAMLGRPFLAAFTFGEQGCLPEDRAIHANLMISVLIFGT
ncbi:FIST signal transduction protein [Oleispirillum naphthae]|uniref:FIST signal transduction protein n=1 Tax=Oleispirillum naphthae TaxID=2838853 RepID=UPI003082542D